jgi:hypothetical protein
VRRVRHLLNRTRCVHSASAGKAKLVFDRGD